MTLHRLNAPSRRVDCEPHTAWLYPDMLSNFNYPDKDDDIIMKYRLILMMKPFWIYLAVSLLIGCSTFDSQRSYRIKTPSEYPTLEAMGYALIDVQPGLTKDERMLQALRASKLDAYRELTEQLYGQMIAGKTQLTDMMQDHSGLESQVKGVVRGARVIRSYAQGNIYITELHLDTKHLYQLYQVIGSSDMTAH